MTLYIIYTAPHFCLINYSSEDNNTMRMLSVSGALAPLFALLLLVLGESSLIQAMAGCAHFASSMAV
jgi:hypothetical protein